MPAWEILGLVIGSLVALYIVVVLLIFGCIARAISRDTAELNRRRRRR